jgi:cellulose biosynthesis protein BcsQ
VRQGKEVVFVANKVLSTNALKNDILAMANQYLGGGLLPYRVHWDEVVPEAFASGWPVSVYAAHSQTAHDFHGVAGWLATWVRGKA